MSTDEHELPAPAPTPGGVRAGPDPAAAPRAGPAAAAAVRILVVDDEEAVRLLLRAALRDWHFEVVLAEDGESALRALEAGRIDLVLTDLRMPGMGGLQLASRTRELWPHVPVIVMTGYASVDSAAEAVRLGAFDYLLKPFAELGLVRASVQRAAERLRLARELEQRVAELRASQARFEGIVERCSDGILIADEAGIVRFANAAAARLLGARGGPDKLLGRPFGQPLQAGCASELGIHTDGTDPGVAEMLVGRTDWESRGAHLVMLRNITARKQQERELRDAHGRLQEADRVQRRFLAMVSHDLHTPIHIVLGALEQLLDGHGGGLEPRQRRLLELARRSVERQGRLVDALLLLARLDEDAALPRPAAAVDLRQVVAESAEEAQILAASERLGLELALPPQAVWISGDADRLAQLVTNLVANALRFAAQRVWIRLAGDGEAAVLEVSDDGPGIEPVDRERIFGRFVRLGTGRGGAGAGLGLAIVQGIARSHDGSVHVEDRLENGEAAAGARFVVRLPAALPPAP